MVTRGTMDISIVIPAYNEELNEVPLYNALKKSLDPITNKYEIILIDDGSTDSTYEKIQALNKKDKRIKCIKFRRNFGKGAALSAGFDYATGNIIITMDADLQDDPEEISAMINK